MFDWLEDMWSHFGVGTIGVLIFMLGTIALIITLIIGGIEAAYAPTDAPVQGGSLEQNHCEEIEDSEETNTKWKYCPNCGCELVWE